MTAAQAMARAEAIYPDASTDVIKLIRLGLTEARVRRDHARLDNTIAAIPGFRAVEPGTELLIPAPWEEVYVHELVGTAALADGNVEAYETHLRLGQDLYRDYLSAVAKKPASFRF